jgi:arylsulfatase A-like enzyme
MSSIARFVLLLLITGTFPLAADDPPNIVMIVADDLGYADLHCQGAPYPTPHLDSLAAAGTRFTDFYVAQPVCTASRAGFLTGCYPNRVSLQGALNHTSRNGGRIEQLPLSLFDLQTDPGEQHNVAREHPEIVARLTGLADRMRRDLGDSLTGIQGTGVRPAGLAAEP